MKKGVSDEIFVHAMLMQIEKLSHMRVNNLYLRHYVILCYRESAIALLYRACEYKIKIKSMYI